ncbi:unnamed protein product [Prunus armeniaca]|uniref:F-box associated domain-containing protein n=1 Tax=Prunus armeniaca TaxID=36596 RepID=A0A6J5Y4H6_PRUAR|nr:unnamed protein product [Prunus armeniaca]CAB4318378.1 unnamed protein product [Prunus armeniaca]
MPWSHPFNKKMTWLSVLDFKLAIFTMGSKEWRDIIDSANLTLTPTIVYLFLSNHSNKVLFINGSIYWHHNPTILAFDVSMERFTLIIMPDTFNPNFPLVEVDDCGSVIATEIHCQPRLWILRSIKNTHIWEIKEDDYMTCWRPTKVGLDHMRALFEISPTEIMLTMVQLAFSIAHEEVLRLSF